MIRVLRISPLALAAMVTGCDVLEAPGEVSRSVAPPGSLEYRGIETRLLENDLVQFVVELGPGAENSHVERYADCAAAKYALIRGYGFARHIRTSVSETKTGRRGDAVYTISPSLPRGLKTIDAEVVADNCAENGIPMV